VSAGAAVTAVNNMDTVAITAAMTAMATLTTEAAELP